MSYWWHNDVVAFHNQINIDPTIYRIKDHWMEQQMTANVSLSECQSCKHDIHSNEILMDFSLDFTSFLHFVPSVDINNKKNTQQQ